MIVRARISAVALTAAAFAVAAPVASAQTPPVDGGGQVGGSVSGMMELILAQPNGFSTFKKKGSPTLSFTARATSTEATEQLSIADGLSSSGSKLGRLVAGSKRMPDPLEARVGSAPYQKLNNAFDPVLKRWTSPLAQQATKVTLRQKVRKSAKGPYRKVLLVTLSTGP